MDDDFYILFQNNLEITPGKYVNGPLIMKISESESAIIAFETRKLAEHAKELFSGDSDIVSAEEVYVNSEILASLTRYEKIILFSESDFVRYLKEKNKGDFKTDEMLLPNCYNPESYR
jgi:hypothetical protein